jgi:hypothetical protein
VRLLFSYENVIRYRWADYTPGLKRRKGEFAPILLESPKREPQERPCFGRPAAAIVIGLPLSSGALLLLFGGDCHYGRGFPSSASCRIFWGSHKNGSVVPTHAYVTPHKTNQEQRRYRPPKKSRGGGVDLGTPAIGAILQADSSHFSTGQLAASIALDAIAFTCGLPEGGNCV